MIGVANTSESRISSPSVASRWQSPLPHRMGLATLTEVNTPSNREIASPDPTIIQYELVTTDTTFVPRVVTTT